MGLPFTSEEVNRGFQRFCPELETKESLYPFIKRDRWLSYKTEFQGKPTFEASPQNQGLRVGYVWCKNAPVGPGYYHVLCKPAYVNLYSRLMSEGPPGGCCKPDKEGADLWDTTKKVIYARSRCSKPDDEEAWVQQIDHMVGTKLNPVHGLKI